MNSLLDEIQGIISGLYTITTRERPSAFLVSQFALCNSILEANLQDRVHIRDDLHESINQLGIMLKQIHTCMKSLLLFYTSERRELGNLIERIEMLEKRNSSLDHFNHQTQIDLTTTKEAENQRFSDMRAHADSLFAQITECDERVMILETKLIQLETDIQQMSDVDTDSESSSDQSFNGDRNQTMKREIEHFISRIAQAECDIKQALCRHRHLQRCKTTLDNQVIKANENLVAMHFANEKAELILTSKQQEIKTIQSENVQLQAMLGKSLGAIERDRAKYHTEIGAMSQIDTELNRLRNEITRTALSSKKVEEDLGNIEQVIARENEARRNDCDQQTAVESLVETQEEMKKRLERGIQSLEAEIARLENSKKVGQDTLDKVNNEIISYYKKLEAKKDQASETLSSIENINASLHNRANEKRQLDASRSLMENEIFNLKTLIHEARDKETELQRVIKLTEEERKVIAEVDLNINSIRRENVHPWTVKRTVSPEVRGKLVILVSLQRRLVEAQAESLKRARALARQKSDILSCQDVKELIDVSAMINTFRERKNELKGVEANLTKLHALTKILEYQVSLGKPQCDIYYV